MANAFTSVVADFKTSANVPGSTRECVQAIISAVMSNRRGEALWVHNTIPPRSLVHVRTCASTE